MPPPTLTTARFTLRPYELSDAPAVAAVCNDMDIVRWTSRHPFPYERRHAEEFIGQREKEYLENGTCVFGAFEGETLVGAVGLHADPAHERAELGYLIAKPNWGRGIATEIAARAVRFGFEERKLSRIHAGAYAGNAASVRVLEKVLIHREGVQRRHVCRFGAWHDLILFGMLREQFELNCSEPAHQFP